MASAARRLDRRAAAWFAVAVIGVTSAMITVWAIQVNRGRPALLEMAESLAHDRPPRYDLASRYVEAYLNVRPNDARALGLKAEILAATASGPDELLKAIESGDRSRRLDPRQEVVSRQLLDCYLRLHRLGASQAHHDRAARQLAEGLSHLGEASAATHRLVARVFDELAPRGEAWTVDSAIRHYQRALADEPGDVETAKRLADLLLDRENNPDRAAAVLDALLRANPSSAARVARFQHWLKVDPEDKSGRAAAELAQAIEGNPRDLESRLAAAGEAIRRGRTELARRHLDAIAQNKQNDPRVWQARGLIDLLDEHADDAIDDWRRSLVGRGGGDSDLAWRMAFVLLSLGRTRDASPLIARLETLNGNAEPSAATLFLKAFRQLKEGRPSAAIDALAALEVKAPPGLAPLVAHTLGQAFEATRDEALAIAAHGRASRALPKDAVCRLALVRSLQASRPSDAEAELRRGLAETPDEPALRIALARLELAAQARKPRNSRNWLPFEAAVSKAREVAPAAGALALVEADALTLIGRDDRAMALLSTAVRIDRRSADLWAALGRILAQQGQLDEALLALERGALPTAAGDRPSIRLARARILALRGRREEARTALIGDLDRLPTPDRPAIWAALGDLLEIQGDEPGARAAYAEWARLLPDDPAPRLFFLERALDDGGLEANQLAQGALDSLESVGAARGLYAKVGQALKLLQAPSGPESTADRGARLGLVEGAIGEVKRLAAGSRWVPLLEGRLREAQGRWDEAAGWYESALDRDVDGILLRRLAAILAKFRSDRLLERLATARPDLAASLRKRAALEALARGEPDRARVLADRVIAADPGNLESRIWQARFLEILGDPAAAEATLQTLADAHRKAAGPALALIGIQVRRGQFETARATAAAMASRVETSRPVLASARARLRAGDLDAALVEFDEALDQWPDDPEVAREAAEAFLTANQPDRAESCLRHALEIRPRPHGAARMLALLIASRNDPQRLARSQALAVIGAASEDDEPEDRLARDLVLSRVGHGPERLEAAARAGRALGDFPTIAQARRHLGPDRFADARALAFGEGEHLGDRVRFAAALLETASARDPGDLGRSIEAKGLGEIEIGEPTDDADFLDRLAWSISGGWTRSARFLDARGLILAGLGRFNEAIVDLKAAAEKSRGRALEPLALFHLARNLARLGLIDEARTALTQARRLGLAAESLGPGESADLGDLDVTLGKQGKQ